MAGHPATYYGRLANGQRLGATLTLSGPQGATVEGRLFVAPSFEDLPIKGQVLQGSRLVLKSAGADQPVFEGQFPESHEGRTGLTCDVVVGALTEGGPATLQLSHVSVHDAPSVGPERDALNRLALAVQQAIVTGDSKALAQHVRYPLTVMLSGTPRRRLVIRNAQEFIQSYAKIVGVALRTRMADEVPHDIFCRDLGCMLADGRIWLDGGKIVSISGF